MESQIAKYSYIMMFALVAGSIFSYLYQVVTGILLPRWEYGVLGVALSVFYIASVLTQNTFSWTGTRRMSIAEKDEIAVLLRTTTAGNFILAIIASIFVLWFSRTSTTYFVPLMLVCVTLLLAALQNSYASLYRALRMFPQLAAAGISNAAIKFFSAVLLIYIGLGATGGILALVLSVLAVLAYFAYLNRKIALPKAKGFALDMIPETIPVSLVFIGITALINVSILLLRYYIGSDVVAGIYNAALTIARAPFFITSVIVTVLFPYISSKGEASEQYAFQSIKYIILFVFPVCISMAVDPEAWLNFFFLKKYIEGATSLRFLGLGMGFVSISLAISSAFVAFERSNFPAVVLTFAAIFQGLLIAAFQTHDLATISSFSVTVSSLFAAVVLLAGYAKNFYFKATPRHGIKLIACYVLLSLVFVAIPLDGRILSLIEITLAFFIYWIFLCFLNLFDERDVEVLLSPFPNGVQAGVKRIVASINKRGSNLYQKSTEIFLKSKRS